MAYQIPFTDVSNKGSITVEDRDVNTETSLSLVGRLQQDYGLALNTNFLQLLENFANTNSPNNPVEGQLWYDTTIGVDQLKIYDGTAWVSAGGLKKGDSEPDTTNSVNGDLWVNTSTSQLYLYSGSGWVLVGPEYNSSNKSGSLTEIIVSSANVEKSVIVNYINNVPITIISDDEFTPKSLISGFSIIKKGINLNSSISAYLNGTADKANSLIVNGATVPSTSFMRNDETSVTTYKLQVKNNNGIEVGQVKTLVLNVEGSDSVLNHVGTGTFDVRTTASNIPAIRVSADNNIGINNANPDVDLDVAGTIKASTQLQVASVFEVDAASVDITTNTNLTGNLNVDGDAVIEGNIQHTGGSYNIGTLSNPYLNAYITNINAGTITATNIVGSITGNAAKANQLVSSTTFNMTGDVSSSGFTFNGAGTLTKTFNTTISNTFLTDKTDITSTYTGGRIINTDELMINRPTADSIDSGSTTGLHKVTYGDLITNLPVFPLGTIMPYAGQFEPAGWKFCNNQELLFSQYAALAAALGITSDAVTHVYGTPSSYLTHFRLPDLRGRFILGKLDGSEATLTNRVSDSGGYSLGGVSGSETTVLAEENLPSHTHNLQSSLGEQFYATTTAANSTVPAEVTAGGSFDAGSGTRLENSGDITGGADNDPLNVTNPFLTLNYIMYVGEV